MRLNPIEIGRSALYKVNPQHAQHNLKSQVIADRMLIMSYKLAYLVALCYFLIATKMVAGASTKEVYLESDLKVKDEVSQEDLNQFFKDQPHLTNDEQGSAVTGQDGLLVGNPLSGFPSMANIMDFYHLTSMLSQLGLPMLNPTSMIQFLIGDTTGLYNQFFGERVTSSKLINHTNINKTLIS